MQLDASQPVLTVNPREIDLGALGPGEEAKGTFYLKNVGSGSPDWFAEGPEGWNLIGESESLRHHRPDAGASADPSCLCQGSGSVEKPELFIAPPSGGGRSVQPSSAGRCLSEICGNRSGFNYDGGTRTVFFQVRPVRAGLRTSAGRGAAPDGFRDGPSGGADHAEDPSVTNRGRETSEVEGGSSRERRECRRRQPPPRAGTSPFRTRPLRHRRLFRRADSSGRDWSFPEHWAEEGGYPAGQGEQSVLRYRFTGTGISLYYLEISGRRPLQCFFR